MGPSSLGSVITTYTHFLNALCIILKLEQNACQSTALQSLSNLLESMTFFLINSLHLFIRVKDNLKELVLSFCHVGPLD